LFLSSKSTIKSIIDFKTEREKEKQSMPPEQHIKFSEKHGPGTQIDPLLQAEIRHHISKNELPCAVAFQVCQKLGIPPADIGKTADLMNLRLTQCQLGLFGYTPEKKIVKPQPPEPKLKQAIMAKQKENRLACIAVWEIASNHNQGKMAVSGACEALNIRIKPCQLGAF
jgi:hypothetical protein